MTIEQGVNKQTRVKRQSAKGSLAGTSGGQIMRRENSKNELAKETYTTESEISSSQQLNSVRHGAKTVNCNIDGILSCGTYADLLSAVMRKDFAAVSSITGASITIASSGSSYTLTRAAGSYLTDGIKIGMVVRLTAGAFAAGNLNKNILVTNVTALVLTGIVLNKLTLTPEGPIASATVSVPGKVTYVPVSGHTDVYYTVEDWYPTTSVSERNLDVKYTKADLSLPGTGNAKIKFTALGLDQSEDTTAYFTAPTAETTTDALAAANGALLIDGNVIATVTDLSINIDGKGAVADAVVGSDVRPDVFRGIVMVTGSFTAYFEGGAVPDLFRNETQTSIISALTAGPDANADVMTSTLTAVKLTSNTPDDNQTGLKRTYNFTAQRNRNGGTGTPNHNTTLMVQDSQA